MFLCPTHPIKQISIQQAKIKKKRYLERQTYIDFNLLFTRTFHLYKHVKRKLKCDKENLTWAFVDNVNFIREKDNGGNFVSEEILK